MILIAELYKSMLLERKFGLTTNVMATKMIPALAPQTVNPALNVEQFANIMEVAHLIFEQKATSLILVNFVMNNCHCSLYILDSVRYVGQYW